MSTTVPAGGAATPGLVEGEGLDLPEFLRREPPSCVVQHGTGRAGSFVSHSPCVVAGWHTVCQQRSGPSGDFAVRKMAWGRRAGSFRNPPLRGRRVAHRVPGAVGFLRRFCMAGTWHGLTSGFVVHGPNLVVRLGGRGRVFVPR